MPFCCFFVQSLLKPTNLNFECATVFFYLAALLETQESDLQIRVMNLTIELEQRKNICESLFGFLLPSLYASIKLGGFNGFQDLVAHLNHSVTIISLALNSSNAVCKNTNANLTEPCDHLLTKSANHSNLYSSSYSSSQLRCSLIYNYILDVVNYFQICSQIESNLVYFDWLLDLFKPLIYALCSLFLLPAIVVLLLYASSLFMFLTKHWTKLKVS